MADASNDTSDLDACFYSQEQHISAAVSEVACEVTSSDKTEVETATVHDQHKPVEDIHPLPEPQTDTLESIPCPETLDESRKPDDDDNSSHDDDDDEDNIPLSEWGQSIDSNMLIPEVKLETEDTEQGGPSMETFLSNDTGQLQGDPEVSNANRNLCGKEYLTESAESHGGMQPDVSVPFVSPPATG